MKEELEYNRSLENRMDGWMDGISARVREMEEGEPARLVGLN